MYSLYYPVATLTMRRAFDIFVVLDCGPKLLLLKLHENPKGPRTPIIGPEGPNTITPGYLGPQTLSFGSLDPSGNNLPLELCESTTRRQRIKERLDQSPSASRTPMPLRTTPEPKSISPKTLNLNPRTPEP